MNNRPQWCRLVAFKQHDICSQNCVSRVNKQFSMIMECEGFLLLACHWTLSRTSEVELTPLEPVLLTYIFNTLQPNDEVLSSNLSVHDQTSFCGFPTFLQRSGWNSSSN
jgi:hypothetical protein